MDSLIAPEDITGLVLAGGQGLRMGGVDKGLQTFNGVPLAQHALHRLLKGGGIGQVAINANRNLTVYASFGVPVWPDDLADFAGPLAGFLTGLTHCKTTYLLTVPCDTPLFPLDLLPRLALALQAQDADIAMAAAPEIGKESNAKVCPQPVFCLLRASLRDSLLKFTQAGGRKTGAWAVLQKTVIVPFDRPNDDPQSFFNANTADELLQLAAAFTPDDHLLFCRQEGGNTMD